MLITGISFPTYLEDSQGIEKSLIDVFVDTDDGYTYIVSLATPQHLEYLFSKGKLNYHEPYDPFILVKELTQEIIEETLQAYAKESNGYWLKFYHFASDIDESVFNKLQEEFMEKYLNDKKSDELDNS